MLVSRPTPFSRLLRQAEDTMDLFYPRSIGVSECSIFFTTSFAAGKHIKIKRFDIENHTTLIFIFIYLFFFFFFFFFK